MGPARGPFLLPNVKMHNGKNQTENTEIISVFGLAI